LDVIVAGGWHHVMRVQDWAFLERTVRAVGAKEIHTDGSGGVATQKDARAQRPGVPVWRVTANWIHDVLATATERNTTLVGLARTVIAFPGEDETEGLLMKARKCRLRIIESPGRQMAHRPPMDRPVITLPSGPSHRPEISR